VACFSVSIGHVRKVQRTGILIENYRQVDFKGAAHRNIGSKQVPQSKALAQRNIIITEKIQFPTIQLHISVPCTSKLHTAP
jgi:hypothetical protein